MKEGLLKMSKLVLTNDQQRKEFIKNYQNWKLIRIDKLIGFNYYRFEFDDGSFITALDHKTNIGPAKRNAIITLTKKGRNYIPISSTQADILNHLKEVAK